MTLSHLLAATGRTREAIERAEIAQGLDPLSLTMRVTVGLRRLEAREDAVAFYGIDPTLDALRSIPAFGALLRRLQLPA